MLLRGGEAYRGERGLVEFIILYIANVAGYRRRYNGMEVGVAAKEARLEILRDAQHIVHYQDLSVRCAGSNPYERNGQLLFYISGQLRRNFFKNQSKTTGLI